MQFTKVMPRTQKLWSEILLKTDASRILNQKRELERKLNIFYEYKAKAETLTAFKEVEQLIIDAEKKIIQLENELEVSKFKHKEAIEEDLPKLLPTFNEEFKPLHSEYIKLQKDLDGKINEFTRDIEPVVNRMSEIERLEMDTHSLKIFGSLEQNPYNEYLKLPIKDVSLVRVQNSESRAYGIVDNLKRLIKKLKQE